jgi:hypothetical protein
METSKSVTLPNDSWICDSGACGHQCWFVEESINIKDIKEESLTENRHVMVDINPEYWKCEVTPVLSLLQF